MTTVTASHESIPILNLTTLLWRLHCPDLQRIQLDARHVEAFILREWFLLVHIARSRLLGSAFFRHIRRLVVLEVFVSDTLLAFSDTFSVTFLRTFRFVLANTLCKIKKYKQCDPRNPVIPDVPQWRNPILFCWFSQQSTTRTTYLHESQESQGSQRSQGSHYSCFFENEKAPKPCKLLSFSKNTNGNLHVTLEKTSGNSENASIY